MTAYRIRKRTSLPNRLADSEAALAGCPPHKREDARQILSRVYQAAFCMAVQEAAHNTPRQNSKRYISMTEAPYLTTNLTREQKLQWCRDRAMAYVQIGENKKALLAFLDDLKQDPETNQIRIDYLMKNDVPIDEILLSVEKTRKFINDFN